MPFPTIDFRLRKTSWNYEKDIIAKQQKDLHNSDNVKVFPARKRKSVSEADGSPAYKKMEKQSISEEDGSPAYKKMEKSIKTTDISTPKKLLLSKPLDLKPLPKHNIHHKRHVKIIPKFKNKLSPIHSPAAYFPISPVSHSASVPTSPYYPKKAEAIANFYKMHMSPLSSPPTRQLPTPTPSMNSSLARSEDLSRYLGGSGTMSTNESLNIGNASPNLDLVLPPVETNTRLSINFDDIKLLVESSFTLEPSLTTQTSSDKAQEGFYDSDSDIETDTPHIPDRENSKYWSGIMKTREMYKG